MNNSIKEVRECRSEWNRDSRRLFYGDSEEEQSLFSGTDLREMVMTNDQLKVSRRKTYLQFL
jgi:hypothetical protein